MNSHIWDFVTTYLYQKITDNLTYLVVCFVAVIIIYFVSEYKNWQTINLAGLDHNSVNSSDNSLLIYLELCNVLGPTL